MQTVETKFRHLRESVYATREDILRKAPASLSSGTIRNAELGKPVRRTTAYQLLEAINALLVEAKKPVVSLDDLGLNVE
jgi:hypothetical protein